MPDIQIVNDPTGTQPAITLLNAVTATGASAAQDVRGYNTLTFQISGITTATVTFEGSVDGGTTWGKMSGVSSAGTATAQVTADGGYAPYPQFCFTHVRANVTAYTSGTITVKLLMRVR